MNALEDYRSRAPRARLVALVVVGLAVATMLGFALLRPDRTVVATVSPEGRVCAQVEDRTWRSQGPVLPSAEEAVTIGGRWTVTGDREAQLTTPSGVVVEMRTDQDAGEWQNGMARCW